MRRIKLNLEKVKPQEHKLQRSVGNGKLRVTSRDGGTWLANLHQHGCAKIRLPKTFDRTRLEAVMINTAGGIAGGDALNWEFAAEQETNLNVTSQACERYYRADDETALVNITLNVGVGAILNWLPQETILFDGSNVKRDFEINIVDDAKLLMCESLVFGRKAMDENLTNGSFSDRWRIRKNKKLIHAEDFKFAGNLKNLLPQTPVMGDHIAIANVLMIGDACEAKLDHARAIIGANGGASFWKIDETGKLLARLIAKDSYELRKTLIPLLKLLMNDADLPKCWSI